MLLQSGNTIIYVISLILATIIVALVLFLAIKVIESDQKAKDKKLMIVLIAFIAVFLIPIILGLINTVLGLLGGLLAEIRNLIDGGGQNYLVQLVPIIGFIILLVLIRWLCDVTWESSLWISLLTLFVLYIFYCIVPELYTFLQVG